MRAMRKLAVVLLLLIPTQVHAQEIRRSPVSAVGHWVKSHKLWLAATGIKMGASIADDITTNNAFKRCPGCRETSIFGKRSLPAMIGQDIGIVGGLSVLDYYALRDGNKDANWREKWIFQLAVVGDTAVFAGFRAHAAYHNSQIPAESGIVVVLTPSSHVCPAAGAGCR